MYDDDDEQGLAGASPGILLDRIMKLQADLRNPALYTQVQEQARESFTTTVRELGRWRDALALVLIRDNPFLDDDDPFVRERGLHVATHVEATVAHLDAAIASFQRAFADEDEGEEE